MKKSTDPFFKGSELVAWVWRRSKTEFLWLATVHNTVMTSNEHLRALPLLSGIAPRLESPNLDPNCHRCSREFGMLTRRKLCNHCGPSRLFP